MITRETVIEKLQAYLNQEIILAQIVDWAENCFIDGEFEPDEDAAMLIDIVMYIAGADTQYFPLTWDTIVDFLKQLGAKVKNVEIEVAIPV